VVPADCTGEATLVARRSVRSAHNLAAVVAALAGDEPWSAPPCPASGPIPPHQPDLADVRGQVVARHALAVAAAGGHHLLLVGPPGAGKTMLAQRLPGLLPPLSPRAALEATVVHSAAGMALPHGLVIRPPLRAPHHTASIVSLVGGGTAAMRPGEISLAHGGVLFMDELAEFRRQCSTVCATGRGVVRDASDRRVLAPSFSVAARTAPVRWRRRAGCLQEFVRTRALRRVSVPCSIVSICVAVLPSVEDLFDPARAESTADVAARVEAAREAAFARGFETNAAIPGDVLDKVAPLTPAAAAALRRELEAERLTGRGFHRVRRVARTICDLRGGGLVVDEQDVRVALSLRVDLARAVRGAA
jgi:magnesium chelatase family protein